MLCVPWNTASVFKLYPTEWGQRCDSGSGKEGDGGHWGLQLLFLQHPWAPEEHLMQLRVIHCPFPPGPWAPSLYPRPSWPRDLALCHSGPPKTGQIGHTENSPYSDASLIITFLSYEPSKTRIRMEEGFWMTRQEDCPRPRPSFRPSKGRKSKLEGPSLTSLP